MAAGVTRARATVPAPASTDPQLSFVVIGAGKSGTTSLYEHLRQHPEIHLPAGKEHPFFSVDDVYERGWATYAARTFSDAEPSQLLGKVEPAYMSHSRHVARRLHQLFPDVKLIAILRDPVERALSDFEMHRARGHEHRTASEAIGDELEAKPPRETGYVARGEYGRILSDYLELFPVDQLLVLSTARLAETPESVLADIWGFLGVAAFSPSNATVAYRPGAGTGLALQRWGIAASRRQSLRALWLRLPMSARYAIGRRFAEVGYRLDRRPVANAQAREAPSARLGEDTARRLRDHYSHDLNLLVSLVGEVPGLSAEGR